VDPTRLDLLPKRIEGGVQAEPTHSKNGFSFREAHIRRSGVPCTSDNRGVKTLECSYVSHFADPRKALPALLGKSTTSADLWLPVRINGDLAAMKGIMLAVEEKNPGSVFDRSFIESYCVGFDAFIQELRGSDLRGIEAASGLTREQIREAARIAAESNRIICC
jgi:hypothetical protein